MYRIAAAAVLAPEVKRFEVEAPRVARKQRPGQFVIVRVHGEGERIPLTIAGGDAERGTVTLIVQGVGKTTRLMNRLEAGDALADVVGPLGMPSEVRRWGTVAVAAGGVGVAIAYPTARALAAAGNRVLFLLGARSRELMILEAEVRAACDEVVVTTDDGSYGEAGTVVDALRARLAAGARIDYALAVGPIPMMRAAAEATRPYGIPTAVSVNSIMVDGTGMCGGCRVLVGGESRFACVDGPEFDAHRVDFESLARRNSQYRPAEQRALALFEAAPAAEVARVRQECRLAVRHPEVA
jgi:ferredoxin/flavodoxin---NADP+ reductase